MKLKALIFRLALLLSINILTKADVNIVQSNNEFFD